MPFKIIVTRDFDHMSRTAAQIVEDDIRSKQAERNGYILGLATGNSPTGLYKHLAQAFNERRIDARRVRTFNLDEYVGLPGENAQQRALHPESYSYFMIRELFGLMDPTFLETSVPWGTLIEPGDLAAALERDTGLYTLEGTDQGKAVVIRDDADGLLGWIKREVLDAYERKIGAAGGIDLHVVGVGGRGHVAFHESGIPFDADRMLLVRLDDSTVANAVTDGHFASIDESPRYAISMGTELVYEARAIVLVANGGRKTGPVTESVLGEVTSDVPISYGQRYAAAGGNLTYVLDEAAGAELIERQDEVRARGYEIVDLREAY